MKQTFAKVNDRIFVGNKLACGSCSVDICLHINRSDYPNKDCDRFQYPENFHLDYRDGELLTEEHLKVLDDVIALMRSSEKTLLVHCNAGGCRSVTLAAYIMAMINSSLHSLDAFYAVERAVYDQRGKLCNVVYHPKVQLIKRICDARGVVAPD